MMGSYADNGLIIKVNSSMATSSGNTLVNWKNLNHEKFLGGLFRLGEIKGVDNPQTMGSDNFMDLSEKTNRIGLTTNKKLALGYIEIDPAWAMDRGWNADPVEKLLDGTIPEVAQKLVKFEPHLYLAARKTKQGAGRVFDAQKLLDLPDWDADGLVWILSKYWRSKTDGPVVSDDWIGRVLRVIFDGTKILSDSGYLPKDIGDNQVIETSEWYLSTYGNISARYNVGKLDGLPQGNYWKESKDGLKNCNDAGELVSLIETIPDDFKISNIGAVEPGRVVLGYKLASNIIMPQVVNESGLKVPFDVISFRFPLSVIYGRYPKYKARIESIPSDPPPIEPPPPEPVKKKYFIPLSVRNIRNVPTVLNNVAIGEIKIGSKVEILDQKDADGYSWIKSEFWTTTNYGNKFYGTIVEEE